jgi:RNA polymerase sigma factor (sigma-70 family)
MTSVQACTVLQHIRRLAGSRHRDLPPDGQLLESFLARRDEAAFAALVRRHGPMVLSVCRGVLRNEHDAEDAFQAAFLVLARKADAIRNRDCVGGWLYGVAYHIALKAQAGSARRRARERRTPEMASPDPTLDMTVRDLQRVLHEELARLPEKYRVPLVLCYLEGLGHEEAARRLGWTRSTLRGRLDRGRDHLRRRLTRRGVTLSVALTTAGLAQKAAPATAALADTVARAAVLSAAGGGAGAVSARVAALADGASRALFTGKATLATALLFAAGLLAAGAGGLARQALATPNAAAPPPPAAPANDEGPQAVEVTGRVLDPDGKPFAGAALYWPRLLKDNPDSEDDVRWERRATSDADGRFHFQLTGKDFPRNEGRPPVVAAAEGFGSDAAEVAKGGKPAELTLRLVKEQVIAGRLLDTQGKPLAGVRVTLNNQATTAEGRLDPFLKTWKSAWQDAYRMLTRYAYAPATATSDKDGRFRITGAGAERVVFLGLRGNGVPSTTLYVVTRPGFDPKPFNDAALDRTPPELRLPDQPPLLYGPSLQYVATPGRIVEGTIRDVGTGKPLAGVGVHTSTGYDTGIHAVSDARGRYRLAGLPKQKEYHLYAMPPRDSPILARGVRVADTGGLGPIRQDIDLARGVVVTGRILDRVTGKGVSGGIRFAPLPENPFFPKPGYDSYRSERLTNPVGPDGRFRLVVIPGPSVLMAEVYPEDLKIDGQELDPYRHAEFDPAERARVKVTEKGDDRFFMAAGGNIEFITGYNALKVLDLKDGAAPVTCDLFLDRGKTLKVRVEDADGKPLPGAIVSGMAESWPITLHVKSAECTVYALDPKRPRTLVFFHPGRRLAGRLTVRGDEKKPPAVRLVPAGAVTGRLLDVDGQPIAGAEVAVNQDAVIVRELYRELAQGHEPVRTDRDGRFRLESVVPDLPFGLAMHQGHTFLAGEPRIGTIRVGPGKTLDLGDRHVKPSR